MYAVSSDSELIASSTMSTQMCMFIICTAWKEVSSLKSGVFLPTVATLLRRISLS